MMDGKAQSREPFWLDVPVDKPSVVLDELDDSVGLIPFDGSTQLLHLKVNVGLGLSSNFLASPDGHVFEAFDTLDCFLGALNGLSDVLKQGNALFATFPYLFSESLLVEGKLLELLFLSLALSLLCYTLLVNYSNRLFPQKLG